MTPVIPAIRNYLKHTLLHGRATEKKPADAYDLWASGYDCQPGNLMIELDAKIFSQLLEKVDLANRFVADIGCGTGRHWAEIWEKNPSGLTGFDVSGGMLNKLKAKFPGANVQQVSDDGLPGVPDDLYDMIISTLTIAHIENLEYALSAWCRIAKPDAGMIITDFHPRMLAFGGKRTFKDGNRLVSVQNYVHHIATIKYMLYEYGFHVIAEQEISIDETVKHYYESQNALPVYEQYKGCPVIYGIHLKRGDDIK
ncbi:MAG: methyltransferase domain-containing protein [Bacteroidetes bacterium]|nr:methyltransferase domain-containing protein [Bacteroidota bacterium]